MKFSDALRGAADRAPVDEVQVTTSAVTGRIKRNRALRTGANGLVGAGAVAVIAFAAVSPLSGAQDDMATSGMADEAGSPEAAADAPAGILDQSADGMDMTEAFSRNDSLWMCGTDFDPDDGLWTWGDTSGVTYTVGEPEADEWEVMLPNTTEAHRTVEMISFADYVITWDGMVVGHMIHPETLQYSPDSGTFLADGQMHERMEPGTDFASLEQWTVLSPVNCWDGQPLPAGDYDVHQAWTLAYVGESTDPGTGAGEPGDEPAVTAEMPMLLEPFRVAADPVTLTIDGEPLDDPFEAYLGGEGSVEPLPLPEPIEPLPVEPLPDGSLTPDLARELFDANATNGAWDMAAGSQRWVITHDSKNGMDDAQWQNNFFGCTWDASDNPAFPTRSADLRLLDVDVNVPARIGVSYGFVVDGNPKVTATVTNSSEYALPGFWSGAQPQLFLVQGGTVVATASPQGIDSAHGLAATTMVVDGNAVLEPGAAVSGDYLWRDVHSCASADSSGAVAPGTYTVLAMHSLSVSNHQLGMARALPEPALPFDGSTLGEDSPRAIGPDMEVLPAPGVDALPAPEEWDSVELQGWTSLGTVTVS